MAEKKKTENDEKLQERLREYLQTWDSEKWRKRVEEDD